MLFVPPIPRTSSFGPHPLPLEPGGRAQIVMHVSGSFGGPLPVTRWPPTTRLPGSNTSGTFGVLVGVHVGVSVGVGVGVDVAVSVGVFVGVEDGVSVGVLVGVFVGVWVGVCVWVAVSVGVEVMVGVWVGVEVAGWVGVSVARGVFVGVMVAVGVGGGELVGVGVTQVLVAASQERLANQVPLDPVWQLPVHWFEQVVASLSPTPGKQNVAQIPPVH
jgi:hypothetical protein